MIGAWPYGGRRASSRRSRPVWPLSTAHFHNISGVSAFRRLAQALHTHTHVHCVLFGRHAAAAVRALRAIGGLLAREGSMKWGEKPGKVALDQSYPGASLWKRLRPSSSQLGISVFPGPLRLSHPVTHRARCEVYNLPAVHLDLCSLDESSREPYSHSSLHSVTRKVALPPLLSPFLHGLYPQRCCAASSPSAPRWTPLYADFSTPAQFVWGATLPKPKKKTQSRVQDYDGRLEGYDRGCSAIFWLSGGV